MRAALAILPFLALVPVVACAPEDVVLFSAPAVEGLGGLAGATSTGGATGGTSPAPPSGGRGGTSAYGGAPGGKDGKGGMEPITRCASDLDCPSSWWCQMADCWSEFGECEPPQIFCDFDPRPVCGCDGITYWNDCVRRQASVAAAAPGECRAEARPCTTASDCGVDKAECAFLYARPDRCDEPPSGTCWVPPDACEPGDETFWIECIDPPPMPGEPLPPGFPNCVDTCTAIKSGLAYVRPLGGVPCPED